jgi:hypothetical protein
VRSIDSDAHLGTEIHIKSSLISKDILY